MVDVASLDSCLNRRENENDILIKILNSGLILSENDIATIIGSKIDLINVLMKYDIDVIAILMKS